MALVAILIIISLFALVVDNPVRSAVANGISNANAYLNRNPQQELLTQRTERLLILEEMDALEAQYETIGTGYPVKNEDGYAVIYIADQEGAKTEVRRFSDPDGLLSSFNLEKDSLILLGLHHKEHWMKIGQWRLCAAWKATEPRPERAGLVSVETATCNKSPTS